MLKIFILCVFVSAVVARPSYVSGPGYLPTAYEQYVPTVVAHSVEHVPTAISHQSQTIVHEKRPYLRPIVDYAPAASYVKAHAPILTKYVAAAPAHYSYAPVQYTGGLYATGGWDTGLNGLNGLNGWNGWNGWPLK